MVMQEITRLSREILILILWVEVENGIVEKVPHNYGETLLVDLPLQREGVQSRKQLKFPSVNHDESV